MGKLERIRDYRGWGNRVRLGLEVVMVIMALFVTVGCALTFLGGLKWSVGVSFLLFSIIVLESK